MHRAHGEQRITADSLLLTLMICMVVEAESGVINEFPSNTSIQCTTVPFKPMLTESTSNIEIRGKIP